MRGEPSPPELIERLARLAPTVAGIDQRKMFGYPALFFNGNILAGLFGYGVVLRLPQPERHALIAAGQAVPLSSSPITCSANCWKRLASIQPRCHLKPRKLLANAPTNLEGIQC
jgi:hypothetical protein